MNKLISNLPFEMHIPGGYQYCGPGTKVLKRIARGDQGINRLDKACRDHDLKYFTYEDVSNRNIADKELEDAAREIINSNDVGFGEITAARAVKNIMKVKRKFGMGMKKSLINDVYTIRSKII